MLAYLSKKIKNDSIIQKLSWNQDSGWIAYSIEGNILKVIKLDEFKRSVGTIALNQTLHGHKGYITQIGWNLVKKRLTTGDANGLLIIWRLEKEEWVEEMRNNQGESRISDLKWSPNGESLCILYLDRRVIMGDFQGNRLWGKEFSHPISCIQWAPDGHKMLFATPQGELNLYDSSGNFLLQLPLPDVAGIQWCNGGEKGYTRENYPHRRLCIWKEEGMVQLMKGENDENPLLFDSGMRIHCVNWSPDGTILAMGGKLNWETEDQSVIKFFTPLGRYLQTLNVPGRLSDISWEGNGLRMALGVNDTLMIANVRPHYHWTCNDSTLVYAYQNPNSLDDYSIQFRALRDEKKYIKYVNNLVGVVSAGEYIVVISKSKNLHWLLALTASDGSEVGILEINIEPKSIAMSSTHLLVANESCIYLWDYIKEEEMGFHVDQPSDTDTTYLLSISQLDPTKSTSDNISAVAINSQTLLIGRRSGLVQIYTLPILHLDRKIELRCSPHKMALNSNSTLISIIDSNQVLTFYALLPQEHLPMEKKDVWSMIWSAHSPSLLAVMQNNTMHLIRDCLSVLSLPHTSYLCQFTHLQITGVKLEEIMQNPENVENIGEYLINYGELLKGRMGEIECCKEMDGEMGANESNKKGEKVRIHVLYEAGIIGRTELELVSAENKVITKFRGDPISNSKVTLYCGEVSVREELEDALIRMSIKIPMTIGKYKFYQDRSSPLSLYIGTKPHIFSPYLSFHRKEEYLFKKSPYGAPLTHPITHIHNYLLYALYTSDVNARLLLSSFLQAFSTIHHISNWNQDLANNFFWDILAYLNHQRHLPSNTRQYLLYNSIIMAIGSLHIFPAASLSHSMRPISCIYSQFFHPHIQRILCLTQANQSDLHLFLVGLGFLLANESKSLRDLNKEKDSMPKYTKWREVILDTYTHLSSLQYSNKEEEETNAAVIPLQIVLNYLQELKLELLPAESIALVEVVDLSSQLQFIVELSPSILPLLLEINHQFADLNTSKLTEYTPRISAFLCQIFQREFNNNYSLEHFLDVLSEIFEYMNKNIPVMDLTDFIPCLIRCIYDYDKYYDKDFIKMFQLLLTKKKEFKLLMGISTKLFILDIIERSTSLTAKCLIYQEYILELDNLDKTRQIFEILLDKLIVQPKEQLIPLIEAVFAGIKYSKLSLNHIKLMLNKLYLKYNNFSCFLDLGFHFKLDSLIKLFEEYVESNFIIEFYGSHIVPLDSHLNILLEKCAESGSSNIINNLINKYEKELPDISDRDNLLLYYFSNPSSDTYWHISLFMQIDTQTRRKFAKELCNFYNGLIKNKINYFNIKFILKYSEEDTQILTEAIRESLLLDEQKELNIPIFIQILANAKENIIQFEKDLQCFDLIMNKYSYIFDHQNIQEEFKKTKEQELRNTEISLNNLTLQGRFKNYYKLFGDLKHYLNSEYLEIYIRRAFNTMSLKEREADYGFPIIQYGLGNLISDLEALTQDNQITVENYKNHYDYLFNSLSESIIIQFKIIEGLLPKSNNIADFVVRFNKYWIETREREQLTKGIIKFINEMKLEETNFTYELENYFKRETNSMSLFEYSEMAQMIEHQLFGDQNRMEDVEEIYNIMSLLCEKENMLQTLIELEEEQMQKLKDQIDEFSENFLNSKQVRALILTQDYVSRLHIFADRRLSAIKEYMMQLNKKSKFRKIGKKSGIIDQATIVRNYYHSIKYFLGDMGSQEQVNFKTMTSVLKNTKISWMYLENEWSIELIIYIHIEEGQLHPQNLPYYDFIELKNRAQIVISTLSQEEDADIQNELGGIVEEDKDEEIPGIISKAQKREFYFRFSTFAKTVKNMYETLNSLNLYGFPSTEIQCKEEFCIDSQFHKFVEQTELLKQQEREWILHIEKQMDYSYPMTHLYGQQYWLIEDYLLNGGSQGEGYNLIEFMQKRPLVKKYTRSNDIFECLTQLANTLNSLPDIEAPRNKCKKKHRGKIIRMMVKTNVIYGILSIFYFRNQKKFKGRQLFFCRGDTSWSSMKTFIRRAFKDNKNNIFLLIHPEDLSRSFQIQLFHLIDQLVVNTEDIQMQLGLIISDCRSRITEMIDGMSYTEKYDESDILEYNLIHAYITELDINKITVLTSNAAGMGKTTNALKMANREKYKLFRFPISGEIDFNQLAARFNSLPTDSQQKYCILFQINQVDNPQLLVEIFFQILLFRSCSFPRNYIAIRPQIKMQIELENMSTSTMKPFHDFCRHFRLIEFNNLDMRNLDFQREGVQIVCSHLQALENNILDKHILMENREGEYALRERPNKDNCIKLLEKYFLRELEEGLEEISLSQLTIFLNVLSESIKGFTMSPFLPDILNEYSNNAGEFALTLRSILFRQLVMTTKLFTVKSVKNVKAGQRKAQDLLADEQHFEEEQLAYVDEEESGHNNIFEDVITWEKTDHFFVIFDKCGAFIPVYKHKNIVPREITQIIALQQFMMNNDRSILSKIRAGEDIPEALYNFSDMNQFGLCSIMGNIMNRSDLVPDPKYVLTQDNFLKMLLISIRAQAKLPIILMGETGCGKTSLIRYFVCNVLGEELRIFNIHAGIEYKHIKNTVSKYIIDAEKLIADKEKTKNRLWIFFDEFNTTNSVGLLKEIICERRMEGEWLPENMIFTAACNPFRFKGNKLLMHSENIGIKKQTGTKEKFRLLYTVNPIPETMLDYVWDFGVLTDADQEKYIRSIFSERVDVMEKDLFVGLLLNCQRYFKSNEDESSVSLRDIHRFLILYEYFCWSQGKTLGIDYTTSPQIQFRSLALGTYICYCLRLSHFQKRTALINQIWTPTLIQKSKLRMKDIWDEEVKKTINRMRIPSDIAYNQALTENVFTMFVCIMNNIPLFICGKPGCSKTLALNLLFSNLKGGRSEDPFFRELPIINKIYYQGSENSKSEGIIKAFMKAGKILDEKRGKVGPSYKRSIQPVVVFDEIGLAEISKYNPLKVLHQNLEIENIKVAFIGISNWRLDASKMNRAIYLARPDPELQDLIFTAENIYLNSKNGEERHKDLMRTLAETYFDFHLSLVNTNKQDLFGLRDFYHFIKQVARNLTPYIERNSIQALQVIKNALQRNFSGDKEALEGIEEIFIDKLDNNGSKYRSLGLVNELVLIEENLNEDKDSRFLMVISRSDAGGFILESISNEHVRDRRMIIGSPFPDDLESEEYGESVIWDIIIYMEKGISIILKEMDHIYGMLYDLFNQSFTLTGTQRCCRIMQNSYCEVHPNFNCIIFLDQEDLLTKDPPFLNRFEKHNLNFEDIIADNELPIKRKLELWIDRATLVINHQVLLSKTHYFLNYSEDYLYLLIYKFRGESYGEAELIERCQREIIKLATPDFLIVSEMSPLKEAEKRFIQEEYSKTHYFTFNTIIKEMLEETEISTKKMIYTYCQEIKYNLEREGNGIVHRIMAKFKHEDELKKDIKGFFRETDKRILIFEVDLVSEWKHLQYLKAYLDNMFKENCERKHKHLCVVIQVQRYQFLKENMTGNELKDKIYFMNLEGWESFFIEDLTTDLPMLLSPEMLEIPTYELLFENKIDKLAAFKRLMKKCFLKLNFQEQAPHMKILLNEYRTFVKEALLTNSRLAKLIFKKLKNILKDRKFSDWKIGMLTNYNCMISSLSPYEVLQNVLINSLEIPLTYILIELEKYSSLYSYLHCKKEPNQEIREFLRRLWIKEFKESNFLCLAQFQRQLKSINSPFYQKLRFPFVLREYERLNNLRVTYLESKMTRNDQHKFTSEFMKNTILNNSSFDTFSTNMEMQDIYFDDLLKLIFKELYANERDAKIVQFFVNKIMDKIQDSRSEHPLDFDNKLFILLIYQNSIKSIFKLFLDFGAYESIENFQVMEEIFSEQELTRFEILVELILNYILKNLYPKENICNLTDKELKSKMCELSSILHSIESIKNNFETKITYNESTSRNIFFFVDLEILLANLENKSIQPISESEQQVSKEKKFSCCWLKKPTVNTRSSANTMLSRSNKYLKCSITGMDTNAQKILHLSKFYNSTRNIPFFSEGSPVQQQVEDWLNIWYVHNIEKGNIIHKFKLKILENELSLTPKKFTNCIEKIVDQRGECAHLSMKLLMFLEAQIDILSQLNNQNLGQQIELIPDERGYLYEVEKSLQNYPKFGGLLRGFYERIFQLRFPIDIDLSELLIAEYPRFNSMTNILSELIDDDSSVFIQVKLLTLKAYTVVYIQKYLEYIKYCNDRDLELDGIVEEIGKSLSTDSKYTQALKTYAYEFLINEIELDTTRYIDKPSFHWLTKFNELKLSLSIFPYVTQNSVKFNNLLSALHQIPTSSKNKNPLQSILGQCKFKNSMKEKITFLTAVTVIASNLHSARKNKNKKINQLLEAFQRSKSKELLMKTLNKPTYEYIIDMLTNFDDNSPLSLHSEMGEREKQNIIIQWYIIAIIILHENEYSNLFFNEESVNVDKIKNNTYYLPGNCSGLFIEYLNNVLSDGETIDSFHYKLYKCGSKCEYIYFVGNCGKPMVISKCPFCGDNIGGTKHILIKREGHELIGSREIALKYIQQLLNKKYEEEGAAYLPSNPKLIAVHDATRGISPITYRLLTLIFHTLALYAHFKGENIFNFMSSIATGNFADLGEYLSAHVRSGLHTLKQLLNCNEYYIWIYKILDILPNLFSHQPLILDTSLNRNIFESKFEEMVKSQLNIQEIIGQYKNGFNLLPTIANQKSEPENDDFKIEFFKIGDIRSLELAFGMNPNNQDIYKLVQFYIRRYGDIERIKSMFCIIEFTNHLLRIYNHKITREEARLIKISKAMEENGIGDIKFKEFVDAWESCRFENELHYGCTVLRNIEIGKDLELIYFLPDTKEKGGGLYMAGGISSLGELHNNLIDSFRMGTGEEEMGQEIRYGVQDRKEEELIWMKYNPDEVAKYFSWNSPHNAEFISFDWSGIESAVQDAFRGKKKVQEEVNCVHYMGELFSYSGDLISTIRQQIGNTKLPYQTESNIQAFITAGGVKELRDIMSCIEELMLFIRGLGINIGMTLHSLLTTEDLSLPYAYLLHKPFSTVLISQLIPVYNLLESLYFPLYYPYLPNQYTHVFSTSTNHQVSNFISEMDGGALRISMRELEFALERVIIRSHRAEMDPQLELSHFLLRTDFYSLNLEEGILQEVVDQFPNVFLGETLYLYFFLSHNTHILDNWENIFRPQMREMEMEREENMQSKEDIENIENIVEDMENK